MTNIILSSVQKIFILSTVFIITDPVYAYLDPGTGSIILQGIIAVIAVGLSTAKLWWYRFTSLFTQNKPEVEENTEE